MEGTIHILCHQGIRGRGKPKYDEFLIIIIVSHLSDLCKRGGVITYDNMVNSRGGGG